MHVNGKHLIDAIFPEQTICIKLCNHQLTAVQSVKVVKFPQSLSGPLQGYTKHLWKYMYVSLKLFAAAQTYIFIEILLTYNRITTGSSVSQ